MLLTSIPMSDRTPEVTANSLREERLTLKFHILCTCVSRKFKTATLKMLLFLTRNGLSYVVSSGLGA